MDEEQKHGKQVIVALMLDDMAIRKQVDYEQKNSELIGYVDVGSGKISRIKSHAFSGRRIVVFLISHVWNGF